MDRYVLKLYISGRSPRAERAIANLRRLCKDELEGCYELEIIDVLEHPQLAEDDRILATPTLIKQLPPPLRRVIGDLSNHDKVLLGLDVRPRDERPREGEKP
ncbi:MAG TPA: circadian clock protein KaiB [Thermoanaerobaculia bacterium]|nr:circadian clock protein KaiB [Thermoanaerobaculia bacterium]